ncbi:MAG TPA: hypothetical protein VHL98_14325 [Microvirga sp.]|jgi:hypothetical protein|nr:hypothetical protein [Microvirga sp.]
MIAQPRPTDRRTIASNDNGRFADLRRTGTVVGALAARRGAVTLSYVADGVMIISRAA